MALCRAMKAEMNVWMTGFAHATFHVSKALLDGRLTEEILDAFPGDYHPAELAELLARAIAHQSGMPFHSDPGQQRHDLNADTEEIHTAVKSLQAIRAGEAAIHDGYWGFYPENLHRHGLTVDRVNDLMRGLTLTEAAQLVIDAEAVPISDAY